MTWRYRAGDPTLWQEITWRLHGCLIVALGIAVVAIGLGLIGALMYERGWCR